MKKLLYLALALVGLALVAGPAVTLAQEKAPGTVILKGAPMGGVKFDHAAHVKASGGDAKCATCHHPSKPEKANATKHQRCQDCHTKVPTAPMKTKAQAAFHDAMAKKGTCIDCHVTAKKGPAKCADCHKKENT
jgi:nitrate/TMAO reductase-like tetraheme cytochrome c subunit